MWKNRENAAKKTDVKNHTAWKVRGNAMRYTFYLSPAPTHIRRWPFNETRGPALPRPFDPWVPVRIHYPGGRRRHIISVRYIDVSREMKQHRCRWCSSIIKKKMLFCRFNTCRIQPESSKSSGKEGSLNTKSLYFVSIRIV